MIANVRNQVHSGFWAGFFLAIVLAFVASSTSAAPLELIKDINPGPGSAFNTSDPGLAKTNASMFFNANDGVNGVEPWISDGTENGTVMLADVNTGSNSSDAYGFVKYNGVIFFGARSSSIGIELWVTDGTEAGTKLFKDINPTGDSTPSYFTETNGTLFLVANDGVNGIELWKSDGTIDGTVMVKAFTNDTLVIPFHHPHLHGIGQQEIVVGMIDHGR